MIRKTALLASIALTASIAGGARADAPVSGAETAAMMAPIDTLIASINKASPQFPQDIFTNDAVVLDDFAPFRFTGRPGAAKAWYGGLVGATPHAHADFIAMRAHVTVAAPQFARISGNDAYLILPGVFVFTDSGKRVRQTSRWLFTEHKVGGRWLISSHAWAIAAEEPAEVQ